MLAMSNRELGQVHHLAFSHDQALPWLQTWDRQLSYMPFRLYKPNLSDQPDLQKIRPGEPAPILQLHGYSPARRRIDAHTHDLVRLSLDLAWALP